MDLLAILAAFLASLTGLAAVGCGRRFRYEPRDLLRGEPLALAYVWIVASTAVSAFQASLLLDAAARTGGQPELFALSASTGCSVLFAVAHIVVARWADRRNGAPA